MRCPYYNRVEQPMRRNWVRAYCIAYPELMIPSVGDEKTYCQTHHHIHCPVFEICQPREQSAFAPAAEEILVGEAEEVLVGEA